MLPVAEVQCQRGPADFKGKDAIDQEGGLTNDEAQEVTKSRRCTSPVVWQLLSIGAIFVVGICAAAIVAATVPHRQHPSESTSSPTSSGGCVLNDTSRTQLGYEVSSRKLQVTTGLTGDPLFCTNSSGELPPPSPDDCYGSGWNMIWQDEFDTFDPTRWAFQLYDGAQYGIDGWGNQEVVRLIGPQLPKNASNPLRHYIIPFSGMHSAVSDAFTIHSCRLGTPTETRMRMLPIASW